MCRTRRCRARFRRNSRSGQGIRSGDEKELAGRFAGLKIAVRLCGVGERVDVFEAEFEGAAGDAVEDIFGADFEV